MAEENAVENEQGPDPEPQEERRWYRALGPVWEDGAPLRKGSLFQAGPQDPRVLAGLGELIADEEPPGWIGSA